jgi:predicted RNA-binding Zn-ribbon protein involved in translation (DUF1610 family)
VKLLDHYSEFRRTIHTCKHCGWRGSGAMMKSGNYTSIGIDKHCPECGEHHSCAKFSMIVQNETTKGATRS